MSRHANLKHIINDSKNAEYYDEDYGDQQAYGNEGYYDEEDYGQETKPMKANKKSKSTNQNMAYEDDLVEDDEDPDLAAALKASKIEAAKKPTKMKQSKSKQDDPDPIIVESLMSQFNNFFTKVQVFETIKGNKNDVDAAIQSLQQRKKKLESANRENIKRRNFEIVEKKKEEERQKEEEKNVVKEFNRKMNQRVEKDTEIFQQVSHEVLNKLYDDVDYGVPIDLEEAKKNLNMVIIGHVDSGKSTLMGHLLIKLGLVSSQQVRRNEKQADEMGKASFSFAWIMDQDEEERQRGITINTAQSFFKTANKNVTIIDAPGHKDFISNMISGASQAECAILVIDAHQGGFEKGWECGQTRDHAVLARSLGVTQLCCAVNKLDIADWSEARYDEIVQTVLPFLKSVGYKESSIHFVPISALEGLNLENRESQPKELKKWYNSDADKQDQQKGGKCLIEIVDSFTPFRKPFKKPLRICIYDYYNKGQDGFSAISGDCVSVKVESGVLKEKDKVVIMPLDLEVTVKAIENQNQRAHNVHSGHLCDLQLTLPNGFDGHYIQPGFVICDPKYPIYQVYKFRAKVIVYDLHTPITKGQQLVVYTFSNKISGKISSLELLLHHQNEEVIRKKPKKLVKGNCAQVVIKLDERICLELFDNNKSMGRIALRDGDDTIAAGRVIELIS